MQAAILVGGRGTRLGDLTENCVKPMLPIGGRPFLEWLLLNVDRFGFDSVLLLAGYHSEQFAGFARSRRFRARLELVAEPEPLGTGGALLHAAPALEEDFFLFNGDTLFDFNYLDMPGRTPAECVGSLGLRVVPDVSRYGEVALDGDRVLSFNEKKGHPRQGVVNGGVYFLRRKVLDYIPPKASLERDVLPSLPTRALAGFLYDAFFIDIGIREDCERARELVPHHFLRPACILDRDGTLNRDSGYTHRPEDFEWLPGARETIKSLNDLGYLVVVVTNQSGVARGYYTEEQVHSLHAWMNRDLRRHGAHIDAFYFCPHHPTEGVGPYVRECDCRKPASGLVMQAIRDWHIDAERSLGVGDKDSDARAYAGAGIARTFASVEALAEAVRSLAGPYRGLTKIEDLP